MVAAIEREPGGLRRWKLVPPIEKVRRRKLTAADGKAYVGVEIEYRSIVGDRRKEGDDN